MAKGKIIIDREKCKGCELCVSVCPKQCIAISSGLNDKGYYPAEFSQGEEGDCCTACTLCALTCPDIAIEVYRG